MSTQIKHILAPPVFEDEDKTRIAWLLNIVLVAAFLTLTLTISLVALVGLARGEQIIKPAILITAATGSTLILVLWFFMRRGHVRLASVLLAILFLVVATITVYSSETIRSPGSVSYVLCIAIAALLISGRAAFVFNALSLLALFGILQAESSGSLTPDTPPATISSWIAYATVFSMTTVLLNLATHSINAALERARRNEHVLVERAREVAAFKAMADNSIDGINMRDMDDVTTYANRACHELFGYDYEKQEMVGLAMASFWPEGKNTATREEISSQVIKSGGWRGELKLQREDGSLFDGYATSFLMRDEANTPMGTTTIFRDITAQKETEAEHERLQQEIIKAQQRALQELSTPIIPVMDAPDGAGGIIVMPLVGDIDTQRAKDIMRALLAGIRQYRARIVILDITGVPVVDSGVASHLDKTIQAAHLKGAHTIITGITDAVAEAVVDLGIDWGQLDTLSDLQTGLVVALDSLGIKLSK
jgi:PAS domain S-box-containing protein